MVMSEQGGLAMHQLPMHHRVQPSLVMNPHPLNDSCSIESQNSSGACPECRIPHRRNNFRVQLFKDSVIEKAVDIRKRVLQDFNKREEDFNSAREYNYLEEIETIIYNLTNDIDVINTNKRIEQYKRENREQILKNKNKLGRDEYELEELLELEKQQQELRRNDIKLEVIEAKNKKIREKEALIDELMFSLGDAKSIVETFAQTTKQVKEEVKVPQKVTKFSTGIQIGRQQNTFLPIPIDEGPLYTYKPPVIISDDHKLHTESKICNDGFLAHIRSELEQERTGGFKAKIACARALQDALSGLYHSKKVVIKTPRRLSHCVGCGGQIHDQWILRVAPDLEWHAACLKCQECQRFLDESCTCFVRDGKTYCKVDYVRLFGARCDKCGNSFSKSDFVMRAKNKIYHVDCFRCVACTRQLVPGDEFALRDGGALYCKEDHDVMEKTSAPTTPHAPGESNNNTSLSNNNHSSQSTELGCMSDSGSESGSHKGGGPRKSTTASGDGKPTRVRTVLNEKQLHTLRTCYAANPRPDALMKEQLVEMTGLSPRVIRVWFQNKRCKDKKKTILMKQQMQQEKFFAQDGRKLGYGAMQGIPMVASSPVRHDSPLGVHPLEVQAYQPPWKALSDYALHADLDQPHAPAFQQLVNQMHGYDLPPPNMGPGPAPGPPPGMIPPSGLPSDAMAHPDSTDSYVTTFDSDESIPASP